MPHASTRIRTSRGPGSGMSRSTTSNAPPGFDTTTALIFAEPSLAEVARGRSQPAPSASGSPPTAYSAVRRVARALPFSVQGDLPEQFELGQHLARPKRDGSE